MNCTCRYDTRGRRVGMVLIGRPWASCGAPTRPCTLPTVNCSRRSGSWSMRKRWPRWVAWWPAWRMNSTTRSVSSGNVHALARYRERLARYLAAVDAAGLPMSCGSCGTAACPEDPRRYRAAAGTLRGAERVRDLVQDLRRFSSGQAVSARVSTWCTWSRRRCTGSPRVRGRTFVSMSRRQPCCRSTAIRASCSRCS